ncbi:MAG TPA: NAD-dependent epimerase/dehydratase family protein [Phototrophicaceae bacterium]|nr:NAD-dependent epimerase/dehydratase family protein [Phototrophicaceae bacterium]
MAAIRKKVVLITGANGEVGHGLIERLSESGDNDILTLDVVELDPALRSKVKATLIGDILDPNLMARITSRYEIGTIYHLAALLSTRAEFTPEAAHHVNVEGTLNLLHLAIDQSRSLGYRVKFLFPSSVAVYGLPDLAAKAAIPSVTEDQFCQPTTMYGCNKLYCEHLGRYYADHYRQLAASPELYTVDFRCLRFPGLISAITLPSGGTSDYAPEMIHAAAQGEPYACFVRPETRIPFMAMPDAIKALLQLAQAPLESLSRHVYNVTSFNPSADEIARIVRDAFPNAQIGFEPDVRRGAIVDSWPAQVDDSAARQDWGWQPDYDLESAFKNYLIPTIRQRYAR